MVTQLSECFPTFRLHDISSKAVQVYFVHCGVKGEWLVKHRAAHEPRSRTPPDVVLLRRGVILSGGETFQPCSYVRFGPI